MARARGGTFLLRIEDIDQNRARAEWEAAIFDDLHWLGLEWEIPVWRQSDRIEHYRAVLKSLWDAGLLFACSCNRRDVRKAAAAPHEGEPAFGPDGIVYPGTCRQRKSPGDGTSPPQGCALRLDLAEALARAKIEEFSFTETGMGPDGETGRIVIRAVDMIRTVGDIVLARREFGTSYHLSVVLDDAAQGISDVIRGQDLFPATQIHVLLQCILGLKTPLYHHHRLIRDDAGRRLAKRDDARSIAHYRDAGNSPDDIRRMVGLG